MLKLYSRLRYRHVSRTLARQAGCARDTDRAMEMGGGEGPASASATADGEGNNVINAIKGTTSKAPRQGDMPVL